MTSDGLIVRIMALSGLVLPVATATGAIRYVNAARPDDSGNGLTWATAEKTLQAALVAATSGDDIWVAAGTYKPDQGGGRIPGNRSATFQLAIGVALYGGFAGGETALSERNVVANVTTLSGDLSGDDGPAYYEDYAENSFHVVDGSGTDSTAVLDGVTISGGNANGGGSNESGGALVISAGGPTIRGCTLSISRATGTRAGGAVSVSGMSNVTFRNCAFVANEGTGDAGALNAQGSSVVNLVGCYFGNNVAGGDGGAIGTAGNGVLNVANSYFSINEAVAGGAVDLANDGDSTFVNCLFIGNSAVSGGAISVTGGTGSTTRTLTNCTLADNVVSSAGGGIYKNVNGTLAVHNSIIWGNGASPIVNTGGTATVTYSIVEGGFAGTGNLSLDPQFMNTVAYYDYRPKTTSPAVDAANSNLVPADTLDVDNNGNTTEPVPYGLFYTYRFVDHPYVTDSGVPRPTPPTGVVDMGAYEVQASTYIFVNENAPEGGPSYWIAAFKKLQDGLFESQAYANAEIWVADGTYTPTQKTCRLNGDCTEHGGGTCSSGSCVWTTPREHTFQLRDHVTLYGGFSGIETDLSQRNPAASVTILSGDFAGNDGPNFANYGDNSYHVVTGTGVNATARLDGFTISGGNADGENFVSGSGGGMYNSGGSPTVSNSRFLANSASAVLDAGGGALRYDNAVNAIIVRCDFIGNRSLYRGGALYINSGSPQLVNCRFLSNVASNGGGAVWGEFGAHTEINCLYSGNFSPNGGAARFRNASPDLFNCTFSRNTSTSPGGGVYTNSGHPKLRNCILWLNSSNNGTVQDEPAQIYIPSGTLTATYSVISALNVHAGNGNIGADPLFVDFDGPDNNNGTEDDDLRLSPGSPAIDAANTPALPLDTDDADGDGNTTERYPFDLAGNPRILDDPTTTDTGVPGSPVADMGAYEYFADCNGNGLPDQCDLSCGVPTGPCDVPGCGGSQDCDWEGKGSNGVPDECDIANCSGFFLCDDCNLNGVPDGCDIDFECSQFAPACISDIDWSCFDNWNIPGDVYPDNNGPVTYSVTLDDQPGPNPDEVFLDVDVSIDTLRILRNGILNVTQTGTSGDLTLVESGGLLLDGGKLYMNNSRLIDVSAGAVRIRGGVLPADGQGLYASDPNVMSPTCNTMNPDACTLKAADVTVAGGGTIDLSGGMNLSVSGDLILDGAGAGTCDQTALRGAILPAPRYRTRPDQIGIIFMANNVSLRGSVELIHTAQTPIQLGGDWDNQSTTPQCVDCLNGGGVQFVNTVPPNVTPSVFEAGGRDLGATQTGFALNFALSQLELDPNRTLIVQNTFANTVGSGACQEALYVRDLVLRTGSTLTVSNCRVYYRNLTQESGASIFITGCGQSAPLPACLDNEFCADGFACTDDSCNLGTGHCSYTPIANLAFGDVDLTGVVEIGDVLCELDAYAGLNTCPLERTDMYRCEAPDGIVEIGDILSILDAYAGTATCPSPCP